MADQYDLPELKLWVADRERKLLEEESDRAYKAGQASKLNWKNIKEYTTPDGRVFRGGMLGDQLYEFTQGGSPTLAEQGSVTYTPEKKITVRDVLPSQVKAVYNCFRRKRIYYRIRRIKYRKQIKALGTRIASRANVLIAEQEQRGKNVR